MATNNSINNSVYSLNISSLSATGYHVLGATNLGDVVNVALPTVNSSFLQANGFSAPVWSAYAMPTSVAVGDLLYASATNAISSLADVATGNALISGGVSTAPGWGKIGLTTHIAGILAIANGGTGVSSSNPVIQRVSTIVSAVATGTTAIPYDDTIPQITEGDQYMTLSITPKNSSNILVIEASANLSVTSLPFVTMALFQDSTANALSAGTSCTYVAGAPFQVALKHTMSAGTTSSTTFRIRIGPGSTQTLTFNGSGGGRRMGGVSNSYITITEYST